MEIFQPALPFIGSIPGGGMQDNKTIFIEGYIPGNSKSFAVNLQLTGDLHTIALHINPRFTQGYIARNTCTNGTWQKEEQDGGLGGLRKNASFNMMILCEPNSYMIAINGQHFTSYKHRLSKAHAQFMHINGDVQVNVIRYITQGQGHAPFGIQPPSYSDVNARRANAGYNPGGFVNPNRGQAFAGAGASVSYPAYNPPRQQPVYNPPVPYTAPFSFNPGQTVNINGSVHQWATRFTVNFKGCDEQTIPFHMDVRFNENQIVTNTLRADNWETEQRASTPIGPGSNFQLMITCEQGYYGIQINGRHVLRYSQKMPCQDVTLFQITGDLTVQNIIFN